MQNLNTLPGSLVLRSLMMEGDAAFAILHSVHARSENNLLLS